MNWVDGVIIVVLIVSTAKGYSQGFVLSLMNIAGFVAAAAAAWMYFGSLAQYLTDNTALYEKVYLAVAKSLERAGPIIGGGDYNGQELPGALRNLILYGGSVPVGGNPPAEAIVQSVSSIIISVISILLIFLAVRLVFMIAVTLLNSLVELPVLKQFNRLGGIAVGFAKGVLGLMLTFALIIPVIAVFPAKWLVGGIEGSVAAVYFYRNNLIIPWILEFVSRIG
jgi:uncharacterized membrane protein required for colicin V production